MSNLHHRFSIGVVCMCLYISTAVYICGLLSMYILQNSRCFAPSSALKRISARFALTSLCPHCDCWNGKTPSPSSTHAQYRARKKVHSFSQPLAHPPMGHPATRTPTCSYILSSFYLKYPAHSNPGIRPPHMFVGMALRNLKVLPFAYSKT